jgi:chromosomal replication initiator protein
MAAEYLTREAGKRGMVLTPERQQYILSRIPLSAREIQGVCVQLAAHIQLSGRKLDGQTLTVVMDGITKTQPKPKRIAVDDIMEVVAEHYGVRFNDLLSPRRTKNFAFPRHVAMYLVKALTELTLTEIGGCFGGRDHSTVLHAVNKIKNLRIKSVDIKQEIDSLAEQLALPQFA